MCGFGIGKFRPEKESKRNSLKGPSYGVRYGISSSLIRVHPCYPWSNIKYLWLGVRLGVGIGLGKALF